MPAAGGRASVKGTGDGSRDDASVASSSRAAAAAGVFSHEQQLLQKLHGNVLQQQQNTTAAVRMGISDANGGSSGVGLIADVSSRAPAMILGASSPAAASSSKVASWLQASEAAFAEERAIFMQNTTAAVSSDDDDNGDDVVVNVVAAHTMPRNYIVNRNSSSDHIAMGECRVDFERIEMTGGGSLTQPMLLAALRASGTGSMKQVKFSGTQFPKIQLSITQMLCAAAG